MFTNKQLFLQHLGQTSLTPLMLEIVRAKGIYMFGPDGEKYIDLISGVCVSNTGHCNKKVIDAVKNQVDLYMHLMVYGEYIQSPQVQYANRLTELLPKDLDSCYFVNSGSEAVEGGLKLAKRYTGRRKIISFKNAYHGSTHGALSIQGSETYKTSFRPLLPETFQIDFNSEESLNLIDSDTACVIVEPVQGEGGVIYPVNDFLRKIRAKCDSTGSILIFDEIQTGFGRLGHIFALEKFGVKPDILLLAKALGGGMPLGAFISSHEIMSAFVSNPSLGHITTFGGHPVSCAAGLASLNVLIEEKLTESCHIKSDIFRKELSHPLINEIRGDGLLMAVQLPDSEYVQYVISHAPEFGIVLDYFLFRDNSFRIAPPLSITEKEILQACNLLKKLLDNTAENVKK